METEELPLLTQLFGVQCSHCVRTIEWNEWVVSKTQKLAICSRHAQHFPGTPVDFFHPHCWEKWKEKNSNWGRGRKQE